LETSNGRLSVVVVIGPTLSFGGRRPYLSNGNAVGLETLAMLR
jgi:hypothetical protein